MNHPRRHPATGHPAPPPSPQQPKDEGEQGQGGEGWVAERLRAAARAVDAPDVVFAVSRGGTRTVVCAGTGPTAPGGRAHLRYEIGSATKVFTGLLLAHLAHQGLAAPGDTAADLLTRRDQHGTADGNGDGNEWGNEFGSGQGDAGRHGRGHLGAGVGAVRLAHLATHTSGLPRLPRDLYPHALPRWSWQPYAGYDTARVVAAFLRSRPLSAPGARWRYSNFGVSVLGHALGAAAATTWEQLLTRQLLHPLALHDTRLHPERPPAPPPGEGGAGPHGGGAGRAGVRDAVGHRADGTTAVPGLDAAGFGPAGAVRATPGDLLAFLEAHADPAGSPLEAALRAVRRPLLRRGRPPQEHTLTWFRHPGAAGPFCFHAGATCGQQAFLGFQPATGTALLAVCTRRFRRADTLVPGAYRLLAEDLAHQPRHR